MKISHNTPRIKDTRDQIYWDDDDIGLHPAHKRDLIRIIITAASIVAGFYGLIMLIIYLFRR